MLTKRRQLVLFRSIKDIESKLTKSSRNLRGDLAIFVNMARYYNFHRQFLFNIWISGHKLIISELKRGLI